MAFTDFNVRIYTSNDSDPQAAPASVAIAPFDCGAVRGATSGQTTPPMAAAAIFNGRRPIRDRIRAGLIRAVAERSPVQLTDEQIEEAITEATSGRPILDWLANGGLEKLIELVLTLLKLAA